MSTKVLPSNEADGLGGFASGTVSGVRTRCYHGLLFPATTPPAVRAVVVNGFEAWAEVSGGCNALWIGSHFSRRWKELFDKGKASFGDRFWNESASGLFEVLDCDHRPGVNDPSLCVQIKFSQSEVFLCRCSKAREPAALWGPLRPTF
jgi:glycogen debranching enzyme